MADNLGYPHCKLCGEAHPLGGPHAWDRKPPPPKPKSKEVKC